MNPLYDQMFNPQYVNQDYLYQLKQREQHALEQRQEIAKAVKALHDYCAAARKITQEYQQDYLRQSPIISLKNGNLIIEWLCVKINDKETIDDKEAKVCARFL